MRARWLYLLAAITGLLRSQAIGAEAATDAPTNPPPVLIAELPLLIRGQPYIRAKVAGTNELFLMLDTGFGRTMLTPGIPEKLGLEQRGSYKVDGIAGEEQAKLFAGPKFEFGNVIFQPRRIGSTPSEARMKRRDGILGSEFFQKFIVEIDAPGKRMRLHNPVRFEPPTNAVAIPLHFRGSTPMVDASLVVSATNTIPAQFLIDTGCTSDLCIEKDFVTKHDLVPAEQGSKTTRVGAGGSVDTVTRTFTALKLGDQEYKKPEANLFLEGEAAEAGLAGHIGYGIWHNRRIFFDYRHKKLWIVPKG